MSSIQQYARVSGGVPSILAGIFLVTIAATQAFAQGSTQELKRLSLHDLLDVEVTTAMRIPETADTVPAAVFVITQDDIRRSGATSIPEALRLVPGLQVARIDAGTWAIGIRGFNDRLSRSVLVLIDGRAVYSPLFAGTYWETQDTVMMDIDRIEVIRGPGGTLWGANAVNGIINIITKPAAETQGLLATGGGGSEDHVFAAARYGGHTSSLNYRAYLKGFDRGAEFHPDGNDFDGSRFAQGGFRADWTLARNRSLTLQGDAYDGRLGERSTVTTFTSPYTITSNIDAPLSGGNVMARFTGPTGAKSDVQVQMYYDHTNRDEIPVSEERNTFDVDFQQTIRNWSRQTLVWGAGYRVSWDQIDFVAPTAFEPDRRTDNLFSAFLQDDFTLVPDRWRVSVGAKVEHNDYSGFEIQPSVRAVWTPTPRNTGFASITRAVRTPSRVETDYTTVSLAAPGAVPTFVRLLPNPSFVAEKLVAYEVGYRTRPVDQVYVTVSTFYNHLTDTLSTDLLPAFIEAVPPPLKVVLPVDFGNGLHGESWGAEMTADARLKPWWRLTGNYSYLSVAMSRNPDSKDVTQERRYEDIVPHHTVQLGSSFDVKGGWSFDYLLRVVSGLRAGPVPGYNASTVRAGWQFGKGMELSIVGQDLFDDHHQEWPFRAGANVEIARSVYTRLTWRH